MPLAELMKMISHFFGAWLVVSVVGLPETTSATQDTALPEDAVARVSSEFERTIRGGMRYMEGDCREETRLGWEGFPVRRCEYQTRDRDGTVKRATVFLLNAEPSQLARWVVRSCAEVGRAQDRACTDALVRRIRTQSGAQFPIAGIVLEDLLPSSSPDGIHEMYCFRDGVTIAVKDVPNGAARVPTRQDQERCEDGPITRVRRYARIQGTTVDEYRAAGGTEPVGAFGAETLKWLEVSRASYKSAWQNDYNMLMVAWAKAHLHQ